MITDWCEIVNLNSLRYKGKLYTTLKEIDEDYFNEILDDAEYDPLFDMLASLLGYKKQEAAANGR